MGEKNWLAAKVGHGAKLLKLAIPMTAPARFRKGDIKRAMVDVSSAGAEIARIEIDPTGKIAIILGQPIAAKESYEWADLEK